MCNRLDFGVGLRFRRCGDGERSLSFSRCSRSFSFSRSRSRSLSRLRSFSLSRSSFTKSLRRSGSLLRSAGDGLRPPRGAGEDFFVGRDEDSSRFFVDGDPPRRSDVAAPLTFFGSAFVFEDARFPDAVCLGDVEERPDFEDAADESELLPEDELFELRLLEPDDDEPDEAVDPLLSLLEDEALRRRPRSFSGFFSSARGIFPIYTNQQPIYCK